MASAPIARKMRADIQAAGGVETAVFDRLRDGETLTAVARTYGVGRSLLWKYLKKEPARYAKYQQAQRDSAAGMVDKGWDLLDNAAICAKTAANTAHVQAIRNQAEYLKWQAGVMDRTTYGTPDKQPQVTISIEHLHLAALQASGGPLDIPNLASAPESPTQPTLETPTPIALLSSGDTTDSSPRS